MKFFIERDAYGFGVLIDRTFNSTTVVAFILGVFAVCVELDR